jgi:uncharacterized protein YcbX
VTVTVHALVKYPIKGCAGVSVHSSRISTRGLAHDREFMLVEEDGRFLSQRKEPAMAVLRPSVSDDGAHLVVSADGLPDLVHDTREDGPRLAVSVHTWLGEGVDQGDDAAAWFSRALGGDYRLVRVPPDLERRSSGDVEGRVGFADGHAVLVSSLSSLDGLNERIVERGAEAVPMNRFRPNVIVSGWAEPHTEDRVRRMTIGSTEFGFAKVCVRCAVPMVDQETGEKTGPEPIRSLASYRRHPDGGVTFGMKAAVLRPGQVTVGDEVDVHDWNVNA